jgi:hypothetical protein
MLVTSCPSTVPLPWKGTSIRVCPAEGVITLVPVILPDNSPIWSPNAMGVISSFPTRFLIQAIPVYHKHVATSRGPVRTSENSSSRHLVNKPVLPSSPRDLPTWCSSLKA